MEKVNKYRNVYYKICNDVGENKGGCFVQFYYDNNIECEIGSMVLHCNTDEVKKPIEYINRHIVENNLEYLAAKEKLKSGIKNDPKLVEIVELFMDENDKVALEELYKVTNDKLILTILEWKKEYYFEIEDYNTSASTIYSDVMEYIWDKYQLNEIGRYDRKTYKKIKDTKELIECIKNSFVSNDIKLLAYRLDMFDYDYTNDLKNVILDKVDLIEKNNLSLEKIKDELISNIEELAVDYEADKEECRE